MGKKNPIQAYLVLIYSECLEPEIEIMNRISDSLQKESYLVGGITPSNPLYPHVFNNAYDPLADLKEKLGYIKHLVEHRDSLPEDMQAVHIDAIENEISRFIDSLRVSVKTGFFTPDLSCSTPSELPNG